LILDTASCHAAFLLWDRIDEESNHLGPILPET
jgi:hypothetical protein